MGFKWKRCGSRRKILIERENTELEMCIPTANKKI
jgi:hypothetical protein